jgi:hypothetical protein
MPSRPMVESDLPLDSNEQDYPDGVFALLGGRVLALRGSPRMRDSATRFKDGPCRGQRRQPCAAGRAPGPASP